MDEQLVRNLADVESTHWWFCGRREVLRGLLDACELPPNAHILEVGCGAGGNLPLLATYGSLVAVEPNPVGRALAEAKGVAPVRDGRLPGPLPIANERVDLIVLADVLEHVEQDVEALQALLALAPPGARLVLTVPAIPALWAPHDEAHSHFRRYRRPELVRALESSGWRIERLGYWNTLLLPVAAAVRVWERLRGGSSPEVEVPSAPLNGLFAWVLVLERALARVVPMPVGLSLYALASKAPSA